MGWALGRARVGEVVDLVLVRTGRGRAVNDGSEGGRLVRVGALPGGTRPMVVGRRRTAGLVDVPRGSTTVTR